MAAQQLLDYIRDQLKNGADKETLRSALVSGGWSEPDVVQALNTFSLKKKYYLGFTALLLVSGLLGGLFYLKNKTTLFSGQVTVAGKTISQWKPLAAIGDQHCITMAQKGETVLVSCDQHLYKSFNGGQNWETDPFWDGLNAERSQQKFKLYDFPYHIVFDNSGHTVYAASGISGIYRSSDGGKTWAAVNSGVRTKFSDRDGVGISALAISEANNKILYAVAGDYTLIRSENGGDSWQIIQDYVSVNGLSVDPSNPDNIYLGFAPTTRSVDGGKTLITGGDKLPKVSSVKSFYVNPKDFQKIMVGGLGGLFISNDGGGNWLSVGDSLKGKDLPENISGSNFTGQFNAVMDSGQKWVVSLSVNPSDPDLIAAGTETDGVIISRDEGKSWIEVNKGLKLQKQGNDSFIIPEMLQWSDDGKKLYLLSNHGVNILE